MSFAYAEDMHLCYEYDRLILKPTANHTFDPNAKYNMYNGKMCM